MMIVSDAWRSGRVAGSHAAYRHMKHPSIMALSNLSDAAPVFPAIGNLNLTKSP